MKNRNLILAQIEALPKQALQEDKGYNCLCCSINPMAGFKRIDAGKKKIQREENRSKESL